MTSGEPADDAFNEQEWQRFVAHLQGTLVSEGAEDFLAGQRRWFESNRERLAAKFDDIAASQGGTPNPLNNPFLTFQDQTGYDSVFAKQIFTPILEKALAAARQLGLSIQRPVVLANAPSVEPSPSGWPSADKHILFIGQGTSSFCNYWSKIFAATIYAIAKIPEAERSSEAAILAVRDAAVILPGIKLLMRYVRSDSMLGFGEFKQDSRLDFHRLEICRSMETFIVGHELGHFILHERHPETNGVPPGMTLKEMELGCDALGFAICRAVGDAERSETSRHLIGPALLFYALRLCDDVGYMVLEQPSSESETHPSPQERIQDLFSYAEMVAPAGDLVVPIEEALDYAIVLGSQVKVALFRASAEREPDDDDIARRLRPNQ
ncbi:hypothetical protein [Pelomonas sp. Root1237]|uniref:hypothetical protein n=1 Tax=Pelomonas sp. Root1237 TaxID=1736434 RepID=UPI0006FF94A3|nr:hypothetical protein [Pelomonas sp. Root1237]KQV96642.1 hypothetical protein ASC91_03635 [Pelomonas sp. Root1237]